MKTANAFTAAVRATKIETAPVPTPEHAIKLFDFVIQKSERNAPDGYETPAEKYFRWYAELCDCVAESLLPEVEPMFIRYLKVLEKNNDPNLVGFESYNYGGEERAQHDAYIACTASLN